MKKILIVSCFLLGCLIAIGAPAAHAVATLELSSGALTTIVTDGGVGDSSAQVGVITYVGSIGVFNVTVDTGITKPVLGTATAPAMHLNTVDVSSGAGSLFVLFSDDGFAPGNYATSVSWGGVASGTMDILAGTYSAGAVVTSLGNTGAFSGTGFGIFPIFNLSDRYAMAAVINHTGAGVSSTDINTTTSVPEPGTMLLLGCGLLGLVGYGRSRMRK